jgi:hypothetical protein
MPKECSTPFRYRANCILQPVPDYPRGRWRHLLLAQLKGSLTGPRNTGQSKLSKKFLRLKQVRNYLRVWKTVRFQTWTYSWSVLNTIIRQQLLAINGSWKYPLPLSNMPYSGKFFRGKNSEYKCIPYYYSCFDHISADSKCKNENVKMQ